MPVQVRDLADASFVLTSGSSGDVFVLKNDGTVWGWGDNSYGQLGNNSTEDSLVPVQAQGWGDFGDVSDLSAGAAHSMALKTDGTVWIWGSENVGELGSGLITNIPVQKETLSNVVSIAG